MHQKQPLVAHESFLRAGPWIIHSLFALTLVAGLVLKVSGMQDSGAFRLCSYAGLFLLVMSMRARQLFQPQQAGQAAAEIMVILALVAALALLLAFPV